ncbi:MULTISPECIES: hypothetical protein [unclassified Flavobacterium]|uniref:hypothetical protein n=1 Tax=unclassified Flavobacterium TaxID=196869 RepID=UPI0006ABBF55|nr:MULTISPECIES: hypothetical protein [unclassified Flavobacterium]KOP38869.1 hypothetical protein AKO67_07555 [Flavobacterium sp. VMW]OWU92819.1 hypothetical protein APR43_01820 [Flavobacterium sp. NLM]
MKVFSISILITAAVCGLFFLKGSSQKSSKGVYVISLESLQNGQRIFKFPDDSIFVSADLAVEQIMRLDQFDFNGKTSLMQSVETYYLIDFHRDLFKDLGRDLEQKTEKIPWKNLREKSYGTNFRGDLHFNENFKIKDTVWEGKKIKKISYTSENREKYDILLEQFPTEERPPVFFDVIEPRFKGRVLKMTTSYPDGKGMVVYTTKFVPLDTHPVLEALSSLK